MYQDLFQNALNIDDPWSIKNIKFDHESKQLDIWIDFKVGSTFDCPQCNETDCSVHDTKEKKWRHLNFFQYKTYLHCRIPRVECDDCGVHQIIAPWARKQSGFTLLMDALIMLMSQNMQISQVGKIIGETDKRVWTVVEHYVDEARSREDYSTVSTIGIDETSSKKGHKYVTIVADVEKSKIIYACEGKDSSTITAFRTDLEKHNGHADNINYVCCDMSPAYIKGVGDEIPNASIIFDKFHVMKMINEAVDAVRKTEQSENVLLKKTRYIWLKNPENLTKQQAKTLKSLKDMNLKTVQAYHIRLGIKDFWECDGFECAEKHLNEWCDWATDSELKPMIDAAKSIKKHWKGILNYHRLKVTNGLLEGLNSIIQALKRTARGYRNTSNFITMIYLRLGRLNFNLPT